MKKKGLIFGILITGFAIFGFHLIAMAGSDFEYVSQTQVSRKRLSKFVYEYSFKVTIINHGPDADAVKASFSIDSPYTTIIDAQVDFGFVSAGSSATSTDTYTVQQDRRYPSDIDAVSWSFFSLPPDPGEEGKQTLLGIDSDNDGVRDDIQRYIYFTYPNEKKVRMALTQSAKNYQELLPDSNDPEKAYENIKKLACDTVCTDYLLKDIHRTAKILLALEAEVLNTKERSLAWIEFNNNLAGRTVRLNPTGEDKDCCLFNVNTIEDK